MFNIETKVDDAPQLHQGRRFAAEDNSQTTELRHVISPFLTLTASNNYQLLTSIKTIADLKDKTIMIGSDGNY